MVSVRTGRGGYEDLIARRPDLQEVVARAQREGKDERETVYDVVRHIQAGRTTADPQR